MFYSNRFSILVEVFTKTEKKNAKSENNIFNSGNPTMMDEDIYKLCALLIVLNDEQRAGYMVSEFVNGACAVEGMTPHDAEQLASHCDLFGIESEAIIKDGEVTLVFHCIEYNDFELGGCYSELIEVALKKQNDDLEDKHYKKAAPSKTKRRL